MNNEDLMTWIATGNQIAVDWYLLTHKDAQPPSTQRYIPPPLAPGYAIGTGLDLSRVLLIGVIVVIGIAVFK